MLKRRRNETARLMRVRINKSFLMNIFFAAILSIPSVIIAQNMNPIPSHDTTSANQRPIGKKIRPTMVLVRSAIVPGWGQFYNKQYIKATIFAVGEGYLIYGISQDWKQTSRYNKAFQSATDLTIKATEFHNYTKYRDRRNLKMWILGASIFYSMFDAYVDAQLADFNQTDKSYEVFIAPTTGGGVQVGLAFNIK